MSAVDELRDEHIAVRLMLAIWRKIKAKLDREENVDPEHLDQLLEFMKVFVDRCHHKKEESLLFPAMMAQELPNDGNVIKRLIEEHSRLHNFVQDISRAVPGYKKGDPRARLQLIQGLAGYIELLARHEDEETNGFFEIADKSLSQETQMWLLKEFAKVEVNHIGEGKHERYHQLLASLEKNYLV